MFVFCFSYTIYALLLRVHVHYSGSSACKICTLISWQLSYVLCDLLAFCAPSASQKLPIFQLLGGPWAYAELKVRLQNLRLNFQKCRCRFPRCFTRSDNRPNCLLYVMSCCVTVGATCLSPLHVF